MGLGDIGFQSVFKDCVSTVNAPRHFSVVVDWKMFYF